MSARTEDSLKDVVAWYFANKSRIPRDNLGRRCDFYEKAICCMLQVLAEQAKDMQIVEKRNGRGQLWLPTSAQLTDEPAVKLNY